MTQYFKTKTEKFQAIYLVFFLKYFFLINILINILNEIF